MLVVIIFILSGFSVFAQNSISGTASVYAAVPLSIQAVNPNLDFGEIILTGSSFTASVAPQNGADFRITGHPERGVTITYSSITLDNSQWVNLYGGTVGQITFTPYIIRDDNTIILSGNSYILSNDLLGGTLRMFIGGSIDIAAIQPHGDYTGIFAITVSY